MASRQPAVKPKVSSSSSSRPYSVSKDEALARKLQEEEDKQCEEDEAIARRLQEEMMLEQAESDADMARRLYQEDREKVTPAMPSRSLGRPMSATPIRNLFEALFHVRPEMMELEEDEEARDTDSSETPGPVEGATASPPAAGSPPASTSRPRRGSNRSPERTRRPGRSPERAARGRGTTLASPGRGTSTGATGDVLPGVRPNPANMRFRGGRGRRLVLGRMPGSDDSDVDPRLHPVAGLQRPGMGQPGVLLPVQPASLPDGEYDPDLLILDPTPTEQSREDNFIHIMRDPFLLLMLLMGRHPELMVPDDIDPQDYESLWDLAERLGDVKSRGMKDDDINRLPTRTYRKKSGTEDSPEECRVCLTGYKTGEKLKLLPCQHEYHQECINEWLKRNASCPICRHEMEPS